jgi:hypothetical protein
VSLPLCAKSRSPPIGLIGYISSPALAGNVGA